MGKRRQSAQVVGGGVQKKEKLKGENSKLLYQTSVQIMEHVLDKGPTPSPQVADENSNMQIGNTVDTTNQTDLSQASKADSKYPILKTYSRRSTKAGHKGTKRGDNSSNWNLLKNGSCNNDPSMVESAETSFGGKINNGASFGEVLLATDGKQNGSVKEGPQVDPASKVYTDNDSNRVKTFGFETNKMAKCRGWKKKKKNKALIHGNQLSVSGSMESENTDSLKNIDLHPEIPSKSEMKKRNNINQTMSAKEENNGLQRNATIVAVNKSNLPQFPKNNLKTPVLKYTYSKRRKNSGQQEWTPHNCSLNSQVNENDLCNRSLSIRDAAEAHCERKENDNASFGEIFLCVDEKNGGSSMKNRQTSPTSLISSDNNSKLHEVNRMHTERSKKPRRRWNKKNKMSICSYPMPGEKDVSGSMKSEITDSVERSDLDPEICSKSEMGNVKQNAGKIHARRGNRANKEALTVSEDDSLDSAQLCDAITNAVPKNEDLCQLKNTDSLKNVDLHPEIPSKSEMKTKNNINQTMSAKEENNGLQRNATIVAVNNSDLPRSPKNNLKTPVLKYTCFKRHKNSGQQERTPLNCSLNSQVNENDLRNRSLSIRDAAEARCERKENDRASFGENFLCVDKRNGGSSMKNRQTSPTTLISSDINLKLHEVNRMHPERIKKPRRRRYMKIKMSICSNQMPIGEKDVSGSMKSEVTDSVERSDLDPEICSQSEMGNVKLNAGKIHARRRNTAKKETSTVSKDDSLDSAQLCDVIPNAVPKNEDFCQLKCETSIEEKSNSKDEERCPCSSVKDVTDDVTSDATMKVNITLDNMTMS